MTAPNPDFCGDEIDPGDPVPYTLTGKGLEIAAISAALDRAHVLAGGGMDWRAAMTRAAREQRAALRGDHDD